MKFFRVLLALTVLPAANFASANELSGALGRHHIDAYIRYDFTESFSSKLSFLYGEDDKKDVEEIGGTSVSYGVFTTGFRAGFNIFMGGKLFWLRSDSENALGASLGAGVDYLLVPDLTAGVEIFYSPEILTAGDFDDSLDLTFNLSYKVIENGIVSAGYRKLEVHAEEISDIDFTIVDGFYLGMKLIF